MEPEDYGTCRKVSVTASFLRLPAELRNKIYTYVLSGHTYHSKPQKRTQPPYNPSLLRVNRQIYAETALLPYELTLFSFHSYRTLEHFIRARTKSQLAAVRLVDIHMLTGPRLQYDNWFNDPIEEMNILGPFTNVTSARIFSHRFMQHAKEFRSILRAQFPDTDIPVYDVWRKEWHEDPGEEVEWAGWVR